MKGCKYEEEGFKHKALMSVLTYSTHANKYTPSALLEIMHYNGASTACILFYSVCKLTGAELV